MVAIRSSVRSAASAARNQAGLGDAAAVGVSITVGLMVLAMLVPLIFRWDVHAESFPPLNSQWNPRLGPGTLPAAILAVSAVIYAPRLVAATSWPRLMSLVLLSGLAWLTSLATVDGWGGIGDVLGRDNEYLQTARSTTDVFATLHEFIDRIPLSSPDNWSTHVSAHPPGILLFFVLLVRLGLGSGLAAGFVVLVAAATTPVAVLITLKRLGAEAAARRAAPFLVFGPAAIWSAVSADALFAACAAWGLCCLAVAATAATRRSTATWALASGVVLGYCVMLSYGLLLLGVLAVAVLLCARTARPLPWAVLGAAAVVLAFAGTGFAWWDAFPVLRQRYLGSIAMIRPAGYWIWGDLAALAFSAGPLVGAGLAVSGQRLTAAWRSASADSDRAVAVLTCAAALTIALADISLLSKAETERIWLPFAPWMLVGCSLLSPSWRRYGLGVQVGVSLVVQSLLYTRW